MGVARPSSAPPPRNHSLDDEGGGPPAAGRSLMSSEPDGAFFYMDGMRTILALVVAFGHVWALVIRDYQPSGDPFVEFLYFAAQFGHQAVILFFVLSGFWIARSVARRMEEGWSWRSYLLDRLARLLPVLIPTLILGGLLDAIGTFWLQTPTHLGQTATYVLRKNIGADLSLFTLFGNLMFLQFLVEPYGSNGPLWSLAYEFWFYIWFPALWLTIRLRSPSLALSTFMLGWLVPPLALAFLSWLSGAAAFGVVQWLRGRQRPPRALCWFALLVTGLCLATVLVLARFGADTWKDPVLALVFAAFLIMLIVVNPREMAMARPVARYGADASFSLYATHFPVMAFAAGLAVGPARLAPNMYGQALVAIILLGSAIIAWWFARCTESQTGKLRSLIENQHHTRPAVPLDERGK